MFRLVRGLIRPYRRQLVIILLAMMIETAISLAGPWPLKIIIDNVVGHHKMSPWQNDLVRPMLDGGARPQVAGLVALAFVVIAVLGAIATYVDNYYTESVGQWVANDLRLRTYHHLQRLSLGSMTRIRPATYSAP
jgi:subfamily B ATP-binding cassette protein MsbA